MGSAPVTMQPVDRAHPAQRLAGCLLLLLLVPLEKSVAETTPPTDCRYAAASPKIGEFASEWLPRDDIFRPLLADPKQPQFFASYQAARALNLQQSVNVGSVGFGENFGAWARRAGCDGWQVGLLGGVFAQFNLDAPSTDLINADYVIGVPVSWRNGPLSARVRIYHQSSHVGDEFLLGNPGFRRINLSFEELEGIFSVDVWRVRLYGGGGYLIHREPDLDRVRGQWGAEIRLPPLPLPEAGSPVPVVGADFKSFEELNWEINTNVVAGLEWTGSKTTRRLRLLVNYYHGFNPYGQFFNQKIETIGVGLYFAF